MPAARAPTRLTTTRASPPLHEMYSLSTLLAVGCFHPRTRALPCATGCHGSVRSRALRSRAAAAVLHLACACGMCCTMCGWWGWRRGGAVRRHLRQNMRPPRRRPSCRWPHGISVIVAYRLRHMSVGVSALRVRRLLISQPALGSSAGDEASWRLELSDPLTQARARRPLAAPSYSLHDHLSALLRKSPRSSHHGVMPCRRAPGALAARPEFREGGGSCDDKGEF